MTVNIHADIIKSRQLLSLGNASDAKKLLDRICREEKTNIDALFLLSAANGQLGLFREVITCCEQVIRLRPDIAPAHVNMANALSALGRHEEAAISYDRALRIRPEDHACLNNYGHALFHAGKQEDAIEIFRKAILAKPDYSEAHHNLANALEVAGQYEPAINHYREAIRINPRSMESRHKLGDCLRELGRLEAAEACYLETLEFCKEAESGRTLWSLAVLRRYQGRLDEGKCFGTCRAYQCCQRQYVHTRRTQILDSWWSH